MILYMTRVSFLDTAEDFDLQMAAQMYSESQAVLRVLAFGDDDLPAHHPTVKMWEGYEVALGVYIEAMRVRLVRLGILRGIQHESAVRTIDDLRRAGSNEEPPVWMDDLDVLRAFRSNIIRRWPERFGDAWSGTPERMPYLWPVDGKILVSKDDKARLASGERVLPDNIRKRVSNL